MNSNIIAPEVLRENCLKFFKNDELAVQVWMSKYALKNLIGEYLETSPQERFRAIASELARIDKKYKPHEFTEDNYYDYLSNGIIMPGGSGLFGIANPYSISSLGNCFVTSLNGEDSYGAILKIDEELVQIAKRRGGDGMDLSSLRPALAPVSNAAGSSTGAVSFVPRYSNSAREVAQNGRRGALMLSLSVNHPDIGPFIDIKLDKKTATGANLSVRVTDEFMHAVECNGTHVLRYPVDAHRDGVLGETNVIRRKVSAKDLWDKMMKAAWQSAEPGILFWDTIIKESPADCYPGFKTESTNPCVSGDTLILTRKGYIPISNLVGKSIEVWNGEKFSFVTPSITGRNQKMLLVKFSDGTELNCTPYHKFYTWDGYERDGNVIQKIAKDLLVEDKLEKYEFPILVRNSIGCSVRLDENLNTISINPFYALGLVAGDGTMKRGKPVLSLYGEKRHLLQYITYTGKKSENIAFNKITIKPILPSFIDTIKDPKLYVPTLDISIEDTLDWLAGVIDTDGSRNSLEGSVSISSTNREFLMNIKLNVLNSLGINGWVTDEKNGGIKEIRGVEYNTNKSYRLIISAFNVSKLISLGLKTHRVCLANILPNRDASRFIKVISIEETDYANEVYCFTEFDRHRGCFNGIVTGQCGEIPLSPYDSCRLLSVNLTHYVVNPFTPDAYLDMPGLRKAAEIATVMMDDIIDLELEKIDAIINKIITDKEEYETKRRELNLWKNIRASLVKGRRAGISVIGHGDMLAMLGMPYADDRSNVFCMDIQHFFALHCYEMSMLLAEQRGAFPVFNADLEKDNPFIKRLFFDETELELRMKSTGRRNIALLTIPPSGSLSILFGNQTSGIEPAFDIVYKRKRKVVDGEPGATFTDATGDKFIEYPVLHPGFKTWCDLNGYDTEYMSYETLLEIAKKSPYYKSTSATIDPIKKVEMQGLIQKYVDHSISITHNLPEDVSLGMVSKIYYTAWKVGCKGCTIYREGSRDGILNSGSSESKKGTFEYHDSPKRPRDLPCDIFYPTINGVGYIILVGLLDGKPFEVFALRGNGHQMGSKGILRKQKSKHYNLLTEDKTLLVDDIGTKFGPPEWNAITRLISWGLRHGGDITFAVDQLNESEGVITDVSKVLARTLKKYVKPTKKSSTCPECGGEMRNEGGCSTCHDCGWSKCS